MAREYVMQDVSPQQPSPSALSIGNRLEQLPISWTHRRLLFLHGFGWLFDAMDVGIITFVLAALAHDSHWHLRPDQVGGIASVGVAGMLVGALLAGMVADRFGRKAVFQITLLLFSLTTLLCAAAWSVASMAFFRFFVGVGLGGELPVACSLLSEFIPTKFRGRYVVLLESFWAFGWLLAALVAFLLIPRYGWKWGFIVGAIPAFYVWVLRRKLPESPRWYEAKGRFAEAEEVMRSLEAPLKAKITLQPDILLPVPTSPGATTRGIWRITDLWARNYIRVTFMLWILWFGLNFGYYGIFVWLPTLLLKSGYSLTNSFGYVLFVTFFQIPGYFSAAKLIEMLGRKAVISIYLTAASVTAVFFGHATSNAQVLIWASLMSFFALGAWGAVYAYTPELYPTRIRTTGAGAASAFGRIGGVLAPISVGALLPSLHREGVLDVNAAMFLLAAMVVALLGVETRGRKFPEEVDDEAI
jgi:MFS transporter, putative metabolite:H+ symporter